VLGSVERRRSKKVIAMPHDLDSWVNIIDSGAVLTQPPGNQSRLAVCETWRSHLTYSGYFPLTAESGTVITPL
jgi:hypothetical protein